MKKVILIILAILFMAMLVGGFAFGFSALIHAGLIIDFFQLVKIVLPSMILGYVVIRASYLLTKKVFRKVSGEYIREQLKK